MPFPIRWLYPELEHIGNRKQQLEALVRVNLIVEVLFATLLLVGVRFFPDWCELVVKRWIGLTGSTSDIAAAALFVLLTLIAVAALFVYGTTHARRKLRAELVSLGHQLCVPCGYDLTGNESGTCPECGVAV